MVRSVGNIPAGTIPGWPDEFASGGHLTFRHEIGEAAAQWWHEEIYDRMGLFPQGFAEALSAGLPGEHSYIYDLIDPSTRSVRLEMSGTSLRMPIWLHGQELRLMESLVYESAIFVEPPFNGQGLGKKIAANFYRMARSLDLSRITLDARMVGKYFWARLGFLPDAGSWNSDLRDAIRSKLTSLGGVVAPSVRREIVRILDDVSPDNVRLIASYRNLVPSAEQKTPDGRQRWIPLGMALLAEADIKWYGVLDLRDKVSVELFERTVGGGS